MRRLLYSLSFRLALGYAGMFIISMLVLFGVYYWSAVMRPMDRIQSQVTREMAEAKQAYERGGPPALIGTLEGRLEEGGRRQAFYAFLDASGRPIVSNLPSWPSQPVRQWYSIEADQYLEGDEKDYSALVRDHVFEDGTRLLVGRDVEDIEEIDEIIRTAAPWLIGLTLLLSLAGGFLMSRAIGLRISAISNVARRVMAGDLGGRVNVTESGDDFDRLGETLNHMLDANERLFASVRRVSDNIAHELRTPLARLSVQVERLEAVDDDPEQRMVTRQAVSDEAQRLQTIFNALLRIASIDNGATGSFCDTSLDQLVSDAAEFYAPVAEERDIELSVVTEATQAYVDADLLFQAVSNLLDNALKHAPTGGKVQLNLVKQEDQVVISICDNGLGLSAEEFPQVTEPFFRGTNSEGLAGEGLGLSVVASIVSLHNGELTLRDNGPGLCASIALRQPN